MIATKNKFVFTRTKSFRAILLFVFCLFSSIISAQNPNQKISIKVQNITIKEFVKQIESKTTYTVVYRDVLIDDKKDISLNEVNKPLSEVLNLALNSKGLQAIFNNNTIIITKKSPGQQTINKKKMVSGIVLDEKGLPVIGASVTIPGTNIGAATDLNGRFTLEVPSNAKLRISYIGYDVKVEEIKTSSEMKISLEPIPQLLNEVVISAQAIGQKNAIRQQINSNTIKNVVAADRLQENPDANATEAIGRLPGISVLRSGGEGTGLVIRGLEPKYTSVSLNGVLMPSSSGGSRETNISGISQYVLQGVEVYKSLTADMEANSPAGTVNLKLREADKGFRSNLMVQMGFNNMNNYFGNYKLQGEISNRFFDNKLGVFFTASAEKVNRSTQTISAGYGLFSSDASFLINSVNLNNILRTKYRRTSMLLLDYKVSKSTSLNLHGLYTYTRDDTKTQAKSYSASSRNESLVFGYTPNANNHLFQSTLSGQTKLNFIKLELDYGVSFSQNTGNDPQSRSWSFTYSPAPTTATFSQELRKESSPEEIVAMYNDIDASDRTLQLTNLGMSTSHSSEKNLSSYLNLKIPFKIGNIISGNIKFGGTYRNKKRLRDVLSGSQLIPTNQFGRQILLDSLPWLVSNGLENAITAEGMRDYKINDFMDGKYNFGYAYDFNKLNLITDKWSQISEYYFNQGANVWDPIFGGKSKIGFQQNIAATILGDQDIVENYGAGYLMAELNFGQWVMFLPGIRYEETNARMNGFYAIEPTMADPIYEKVSGNPTTATRSDKFLLPMLHLRIKPTKYFYTHIAYTKTLSRPDFNSISPNTWVNTGIPPFAHVSSNPNLNAEQWTNYDVQFTLYGPKIGLFSVSGFYKTVKDKIWNRSYQRIKGDPILEPFQDANLVNVTLIENHQYPIYLKGVEVELQTSFWYLPKPFNYFTLTTNYTYTGSKTQNPFSYIKTIIPPGGGRPVATRIDTTITSVMLHQPKHIVNLSLGFNRKGLNIWLSYQYNGMGYTSFDQSLEELGTLKEFYNRWDMQISQKLSGKLKGLELVANIANLNDFTESSRFIGDIRPTYMEKYGWTADVGLRYKFR